MGGFFESIFDVFYLVLVISVGIKLLFIEDCGARLFGWMGIVLGTGDAFHLIPRIMAHMTAAGMQEFAGLLSWGKMVTSVTMTVFYLMYYLYYKRETGKISALIDGTVYALAAVRILLTILPQNGWGSGNESYAWAIGRNIPFFLMGVLLVVLSAGEKGIFRKYALLIALSFLFYIPVVLFADRYPVTGMLMMPKTAAYFLLVYFGYRSYQKKQEPEDMLTTAMAALLFGLTAGVMYREFTKVFRFEGKTALSLVHPHILLLGCVFGILLYFLWKEVSPEEYRKAGGSVLLWKAGLILTIAMMWIKGINQVVGGGASVAAPQAFSGAAGLGHLLLGIGLVRLMLSGIRANRKQSER